MIGTKVFDFAKKSVFICLSAAALSLLPMPLLAEAGGENEILVMAYSSQEGMGNITSSCNNAPFQDSVTASPGNVILVTAQAYPKCTFEGWYVNGTLKSLQQSFSFEVAPDASMYLVTARFRQNGEHLRGQAKMEISQTNWSNRTCRFAQGSGSPDIAVTTTAAVQGEACMETFRSVLEDYTIARTYNITFTKYYNQNLAVLDEPADFVFQIPQELQAQGRVFRMIYVNKGLPTVLMDADASDSTITFRNDKAGAYALVYRDVPSSMPVDSETYDMLMFVTPDEETTVYLPVEQITTTDVLLQDLPSETVHNYYIPSEAEAGGGEVQTVRNVENMHTFTPGLPGVDIGANIGTE